MFGAFFVGGMMDIIRFLAEDRACLMYRPSLNKITGSVTATILLSQILYWWIKSERKPFFKFNNECQHKLYKKGDSWQEETGFSRREFDGARKALLKNGFISIKITREKLTIYTVYEEIITQALNNCKCAKRTSANVQNVHLIESKTTQEIQDSVLVNNVNGIYESDGLERVIIQNKDNLINKNLLSCTAEENLKKKSKKQELSNDEKTLYKKIWNTFLQKNDNMFTNYPKEAKGTLGLVKKIMARCNNDISTSLAFLDSLFTSFVAVRKDSKDKFWAEQPELPSTFNASGIFDRLLTAGKRAREAEEAEIERKRLDLEKAEAYRKRNEKKR